MLWLLEARPYSLRWTTAGTFRNEDYPDVENPWLWQDDRWSDGTKMGKYNVYIGLVIRAETESEARELAPTDGAETSNSRFDATDYNPWLDNNWTSCEPLEQKGEATIVLTSYINDG